MIYKRKAFLVLLSLMFMLVGCNKEDSLPKNNDQIGNIPGENHIDDPNKDIIDTKPIDPIEEKIKALSLEEKIGQLIIASFEGD